MMNVVVIILAVLNGAWLLHRFVLTHLEFEVNRTWDGQKFCGVAVTWWHLQRGNHSYNHGRRFINIAWDRT